MNVTHKRLSQTYYATWIPRKYGGKLEQSLVSLRENETGNRSQIEALRWAAIRRLLAHAEQHVPYYSNLFRQNGLRADEITDEASFSRIPLLTKVDIQENLESLVADNVRAEGPDPIWYRGLYRQASPLLSRPGIRPASHGNDAAQPGLDRLAVRRPDRQIMGISL